MIRHLGCSSISAKTTSEHACRESNNLSAPLQKSMSRFHPHMCRRILKLKQVEVVFERWWAKAGNLVQATGLHKVCSLWHQVPFASRKQSRSV